MNNLIKIELSKINLKNQFITLIISNVIIFFLVIAMKFLLPGEVSLVSPGGSPLPKIDMGDMIIIDVLIKATFIVWCSTLFATYIVAEFQKKTALMLFTYPVKISKIIASKVLVIFTIIFSFMMLSEIIQNALVLITSNVVQCFIYKFNVYTFYNIFLTNIGTLLLCLVSLYVGLINKSSVATVVTSIIVVSFVTSSAAGPGGIITKVSLSFILGLIGVVCYKLSIKKIVSEDYV